MIMTALYIRFESFDALPLMLQSCLNLCLLKERIVDEAQQCVLVVAKYLMSTKYWLQASVLLELCLRCCVSAAALTEDLRSLSRRCEEMITSFREPALPPQHPEVFAISTLAVDEDQGDGPSC